MESLALNSTILTPRGFRPRVNGPRDGVGITPQRLWGADDVAGLREAPFVRVTDGDLNSDRASLETVVALALSGVPVTGRGLPATLRDRLDRDLLAILDTISPEAAADADERELASVMLRRRAWEIAGYRPPTDTPAVLVLLRGGEHSAYPEQDLAGQLTPGLTVRRRLVDEEDDAAQVVREEREQGAVYVTRMDAGLRYGPHHLADLVHALAHSGARVALSPRRFVPWQGAWLEDGSGAAEEFADRGLPGGSLWYAVDGPVEPVARGDGYVVHGGNAVPVPEEGAPREEDMPQEELAPLRMHQGLPRLLGWLGPDAPEQDGPGQEAPEQAAPEQAASSLVGPSYFAVGSGEPERARSAVTASES